MLIVVFTAFVVWSLLVGSIPSAGAIFVGAILGMMLKRHGHSHAVALQVDYLARHSRFSVVDPCVKLFFCMGLVILCVLSQTPWPPIVLFLLLATMTCAGGVDVRVYWSVLTVPALFLVAGTVAMLWTYSPVSSGIVYVPLAKAYLVLEYASQQIARLVAARALGSVSCLYFLSLTTTMSEIVEAMRRFHFPPVVLDLCILIYRYIFLLLVTFQNMNHAATSRLGFVGAGRSIRTAGILYGNLLARSFRRAQACFDAMESRCCMEHIQFYTRKDTVKISHIAVGTVLMCAMAIAVLYKG